MFLITITEDVARSVTKTFGIIIGVGLLLSPFILIANATGLPPVIVIVVGVLLMILFVAFLLTRGGSERRAQEAAQADLLVRGQCSFIRANGTQCRKAKGSGMELCAHHAAKTPALEPAKTTKKPSARRKMKHCGLVQEDGSKCKKLRYPEAEYCSYHTSLKNAEAPQS